MDPDIRPAGREKEQKMAEWVQKEKDDEKMNERIRLFYNANRFLFLDLEQRLFYTKHNTRADTLKLGSARK